MIRTVLRVLMLRRFVYVLYRRASASTVGMTAGLSAEIASPGERLSPLQRAFLRRHTRWSTVWWILRRQEAWVFFMRSETNYCHYSFVTGTRRLRSILPPMRGQKSLLIGPCFTEVGFRGKNINPTILGYIGACLSQKGYGPFYVDTTPDNRASMRGSEKAGFEKIGTWAGWRMLGDLFVRTRLLE